MLGRGEGGGGGNRDFREDGWMDGWGLGGGGGEGAGIGAGGVYSRVVVALALAVSLDFFAIYVTVGWVAIRGRQRFAAFSSFLDHQALREAVRGIGYRDSMCTNHISMNIYVLYISRPETLELLFWAGKGSKFALQSTGEAKGSSEPELAAS